MRRGKEKAEELVLQLENILKQHYYFRYGFEGIAALNVVIGGDSLADGIYVQRVEMVLRTIKGHTWKVNDWDELIQLFYETRGQTGRGQRLPSELFENIYDLELRSIRDFLSDGQRKKVGNICLAFYYDVWHDYETGEIQNIVYQKE